MTHQNDWHVLRRPLRSCAIGGLGLLAFLVFWQVAVPEGKDYNPEDSPNVWPFIFMTSVCVPTGFGLAVSACRQLWRTQRRSMALVPPVFLIAVVVAFPAAVSAVGGGWLIGPWSVLLAFLVSALLSAYLMTSTQAAPPPARPIDFNADEPDAYARDVDQDEKRR
jgi:cytochrome bd-type quinol oxidase subunit 1